MDKIDKMIQVGDADFHERLAGYIASRWTFDEDKNEHMMAALADRFGAKTWKKFTTWKIKKAMGL